MLERQTARLFHLQAGKEYRAGSPGTLLCTAQAAIVLLALPASLSCWERLVLVHCSQLLLGSSSPTHHICWKGGFPNKGEEKGLVLMFQS